MSFDPAQGTPAGRRIAALLVLVAVPYATLWAAAAAVEALELRMSYDLRTGTGRLSLIVIASPLAGALLAAALEGGRSRVRALLARALAWRFPPRWYLLALLTPFGVIAASAAFSVVVLDVPPPARWLRPRMPAGSMAFLLVYIGLGEEIAWRGYLLPRLQALLGGLGASVAVGVVWALWHLPLFLLPGTFQYGTSLGLFVYLLVCWSVLMTAFVHGARGSALVAILFHGAVNFTAFALRYPGPYTYVFWGLAALVAVPWLPRPLLGRPGRQAP